MFVILTYIFVVSGKSFNETCFFVKAKVQIVSVLYKNEALHVKSIWESKCIDPVLV